MKCIYCGRELRRQSRFCLGCGRQVVLKDVYAAAFREAGEALESDSDKAKLDNIIRYTEAILDRVGEKPELVQESKNFIGRFLPTFESVMSRYKRLHDSDVRNEPYEGICRQVSEMLDMTEEAFENLLNKLYQDDLMDMQSSIAVFRTLLAQEGLMDSDFE